MTADPVPGSAATGQVHAGRRLVAIPIFDRFTALDAIGPYEVLQRLPHFDVVFCSTRTGEIRTDHGMLGVIADRTLEQVPRPDIVVVPGGIGSRAAMQDAGFLRWVQAAHATSTWTTSVCTGSLILGAAGLLDGLTATGHYSATDALAATGATPAPERVIVHEPQRIMTAAGVSAGIDMALTLVAHLEGPDAAQAVQLMIEYAPEPPFSTGSPATADDAVMSLAQQFARYRD